MFFASKSLFLPYRFYWISILFVNKSISLPKGVYRIFNISRIQKPTPPLSILLNFPYSGFYWIFHIFRTQKPTVHNKAYRAFLWNSSIIFEHRCLPLPPWIVLKISISIMWTANQTEQSCTEPDPRQFQTPRCMLRLRGRILHITPKHLAYENKHQEG